MKVIIRKNPMFANYLGERMCNRHRIETFVGIDNKFDAVVATRFKNNDRFLKTVIMHLLRWDEDSFKDRSGIEDAAKDFLKNEVFHLS